MHRLFAAIALLMLSVPALAGWWQAETAHFRVFGDAPPERVVRRAALLEDFHGLMVEVTGRDLPKDAAPLDVFLVDNLADASPWRPLAPNVAGFYRADSGRISAVALNRGDAKDGGLSGQEILLHEYAHHFMLGSSLIAYPAWYVEGFAEYFATARFAADRIEYGQISDGRANWLRAGKWLSLQELLSGAPLAGNASDVTMFYAQSWLLTHYMLRAPGMRTKLIAYLKATGEGQDPVEAFRTHVDSDLPGFQARLRRYLEMRATYTKIDRPRPAHAKVSTKELPGNGGELLLRLAALEHGVPSTLGQAALLDVREIASRDAGDALATRTLALAELQLGDPGKALQLIEGLLSREPKDADLWRWRAQALRTERTSNGSALARASLEKSLALAPSDWRTLRAMARITPPSSPQSLGLMLKAHEQAPQVSEVVLDTALALSQADRLEEAAIVLQPLAWSPHGGAAAEVAQKLLLKARAGDREGVLQEAATWRRPRASAAGSSLSRGSAQLR